MTYLNRVREKNRRLNDRFFPRSLPRYNSRFRELARELSANTALVLHLGAGTVNLEPHLKPVRSRPRLVALDLSHPSLRRNSSALRVCGDAETLPLPSSSMDLIVSEHVFEHFPRPLVCLKECLRVLKSGGNLVVSGPNGWSYVGLAARITPLRFHTLVRQLGAPSKDEDVDGFPTFYRFSTPRAMRRLAARAGFEVVSIEKFVGEPWYTTFLPWLHRVFIGYHLLLERFKPVLDWHMTSVGVFRKP